MRSSHSVHVTECITSRATWCPDSDWTVRGSMTYTTNSNAVTTSEGITAFLVAQPDIDWICYPVLADCPHIESAIDYL